MRANAQAKKTEQRRRRSHRYVLNNSPQPSTAWEVHESPRVSLWDFSHRYGDTKLRKIVFYSMLSGIKKLQIKADQRRGVLASNTLRLSANIKTELASSNSLLKRGVKFCYDSFVRTVGSFFFFFFLAPMLKSYSLNSALASDKSGASFCADTRTVRSERLHGDAGLGKESVTR